MNKYMTPLPVYVIFAYSIELYFWNVECLIQSSRRVRNAAYEHLGSFLSVLTSEQIKPELVKYFVNIPNLSSAEADADCSNHCAFNFPGMLS